MKTFRQLIGALPPGPIYVNQADLDTPITAPVTEDNRLIEPGGVFVARQGLSVDGHDFIPDAIERGAAVIVGERDLPDVGGPYVRVANAQLATGYLAAAYHGFPSRGLIVIGVTAIPVFLASKENLPRVRNCLHYHYYYYPFLRYQQPISLPQHIAQYRQ